MVRSRPDLLTDLYTSVVPLLIRRFSDRDDVVKGEVFTAFQQVLHTGSRSAAEQSVEKVCGGSTNNANGAVV